MPLNKKIITGFCTIIMIVTVSRLLENASKVRGLGTGKVIKMSQKDLATASEKTGNVCPHSLDPDNILPFRVKRRVSVVRSGPVPAPAFLLLDLPFGFFEIRK